MWRSGPVASVQAKLPLKTPSGTCLGFLAQPLGTASQQQKVCRSTDSLLLLQRATGKSLAGTGMCYNNGQGNFLSTSRVRVLGRAVRAPGALRVLISWGHGTNALCQGPAGSTSATVLLLLLPGKDFPHSLLWCFQRRWHPGEGHSSCHKCPPYLCDAKAQIHRAKPSLRRQVSLVSFMEY